MQKTNFHNSTPGYFRFALSPIHIALLISAGSLLPLTPVTAKTPDNSPMATFDNSMLWGNGAHSIDLSRYAEGNPVEAGKQAMDVSMNTHPAGNFEIDFIEGKRPGQAEPCLTADLLERLSVDTDKLPEASKGRCIALSQIDSAGYNVDFGEQRLTLTLPQIYMRQNARGSTSPERWDRGVTAGFIDYNINGYQYTAKDQSGQQKSQSVYAGLNIGLNLGAWRLRQRSSLNWDSENGSETEAMQTYIQRDIDRFRAQLTLGDTFSDGELFDSMSIRGLQIATDDRMLPDSMVGYAPAVRGIAATNARVTVRQRGYIIYETTVSPGAFEINDLNPGSNNGDLEVTVTEADGRESHFMVPFSSVARSLRPGMSRYTASIGKVRDLQYGYAPYIAQATWQRGLSNAITGYFGITTSESYRAIQLGGVLATSYGAFGADVTQAKTDLGSSQSSGQSIRLSYNKILVDTGTDITLSAYRYSTKGYFGLNDALSAIDQVKEEDDISADDIYRLRSRSELIVNQRVTDIDSFFVSGSRQDYWNNDEHDTQFQAGYTRSWDWGTSSVSASRTQDTFGQSENRVMLSLSVPFGGTAKRNHLTTSLNYSANGTSSAQTSINGVAGKNDQVSYGLTAGYERHKTNEPQSSLAANAQYSTSFGSLNSSISRSTTYQQTSAGIQGSVVAHPAGLTFGQSLGDSIAIIDAPGATGAEVLSTHNLSLDGHGQAVVPYLSPYRRNELALDPKNLSDDVELESTSQEVVPRSGAVVMVKYNTLSGRAVLINGRKQDGSPLPFGASVRGEDGRTVGIVGQGGQIFARLEKDQGVLKIGSLNDSSGQCSLTYDLSSQASLKNTGALQQIDLVCQRSA